MIQIGTLLQERYLIERQIGAGGMGAVYLAVDQRFESYVAIKQTFYNDDELGEAFEREARLLNGLLHPVLPHVSDYFTEAGGHFLVMQYIEGEDLFAILKRDGAFPVKDVLRWTDSLLDALDYLHSQEPPIIHRDIKPHNLKITPRGDVILLDFGLAKLKSENTTGIKSIFGYSRKYSPLEQIQGTGTDGRSDLFALAATAYHLLTGKPPIDVLARAAEIIVGNPDPLRRVSEINSEVSASVANVLHTAMALNAAGRFFSAKAMRHALENAVSGAVQSEETAVLPEQVPPLPADVDAAAIAAAALAAENAVVISPENEEFPALEAFAANAANAAPSPAVEIVEPADDKVSLPPQQVEAAAPAAVEPTLVQESIVVADVPTKVAPPSRRRQLRMPAAAALAILIICAGLAVGYFINRAAGSSNQSQPSPTESTQESNSPNAGQNDVVLDAPAPEAIDSPLPENVEQAAKTRLPAIEKKVEKKEIADEPEPADDRTETAEKPKPAPQQQVEEAPRTPAQPAKRTEAQRRSQTAPRRVESEPVPDIESVFTGRRSERRSQNRGQNRIPPEDMSEEDWREWRRQRREDRRRRQQNRNYFPF